MLLLWSVNANMLHLSLWQTVIRFTQTQTRRLFGTAIKNSEYHISGEMKSLAWWLTVVTYLHTQRDSGTVTETIGLAGKKLAVAGLD